MTINPDSAIVFSAGPLRINATIFFTWVVMALLAGVSAWVSAGLSSGPKISRWQSALETVYEFISGQIKSVTGGDPTPYVPFLGALGLFILTANLMEAVPLFHTPTSSLSATFALSVSVFFAVPFFAIARSGPAAYLRSYFSPNPFMFPFHIISELSRTVSLAVRLFGNMMSEGLIAGVLLSIVPLFVPVAMQLFGLIIGAVQAYIFFTLATVYIGAAASAHKE